MCGLFGQMDGPHAPSSVPPSALLLRCCWRALLRYAAGRALAVLHDICLALRKGDSAAPVVVVRPSSALLPRRGWAIEVPAALLACRPLRRREGWREVGRRAVAGRYADAPIASLETVAQWEEGGPFRGAWPDCAPCKGEMVAVPRGRPKRVCIGVFRLESGCPHPLMRSRRFVGYGRHVLGCQPLSLRVCRKRFQHVCTEPSDQALLMLSRRTCQALFQ